jgi:hypothetical protein
MAEGSGSRIKVPGDAAGEINVPEARSRAK